MLAATHASSGRRVAIKRIRGVFQTLGTATQAMRELALHRRVDACPASRGAVARLLDVPCRQPTKAGAATGRSLYIVFERLDDSLAGEIARIRAGTSDLGSVVQLAHRLVDAVARLHAAGVAHRDLKPQNVLVDRRAPDGGVSRLVLCDLGMSRRVVSGPDEECAAPAGADDACADDACEDDSIWTEYVTTRWYRAPEICCRCEGMSPMAADMWAVGCIIAEMQRGGRVLFPGRDLHSQIDSITAGCPGIDGAAIDWYRDRARDEVAAMRLIRGGKAVRGPGRGLEGGGAEGGDLVRRLLAYDPARRPTAREALDHPYFASMPPKGRLSLSHVVADGGPQRRKPRPPHRFDDSGSAEPLVRGSGLLVEARVQMQREITACHAHIADRRRRLAAGPSCENGDNGDNTRKKINGKRAASPPGSPRKRLRASCGA